MRLLKILSVISNDNFDQIRICQGHKVRLTLSKLPTQFFLQWLVPCKNIFGLPGSFHSNAHNIIHLHSSNAKFTEQGYQSIKNVWYSYIYMRIIQRHFLYPIYSIYIYLWYLIVLNWYFRQHQHFTMDDIIDHLAFCIRHEMSSSAFLQRYTQKRPSSSYPGKVNVTLRVGSCPQQIFKPQKFI